ncbi:carbonic anhydrase [Phreatobacter stygius]|uniref:carbonic anhydrase n=1 Tax=Phreatobacter stygius TaxID=1940610 RepID=A0A4D7AWY9_9HYPH|nr:carbonic anhydrase [Phreatobacter stygius]QCI66124.1 carbonic anhydrase [Phreatobacter stygius]
MCETCVTMRRTRRHVLVHGALGIMATLGGLGAIGTAAASDTPPTHLGPDQALEQLKAGNRRFVADPQACVSDMAKRRRELVAGQAPWATLVSCADSRVPPELVFGGLSLGELFVIRNAGNTVDTVAMGTLEYGAAVLKSPLIVVLGHERCGAVAAACDVVAKNATFPGAIGPMIEPIVPAAIAARGRDGDFVDNTVRENVRRTVARLKLAGPLIADMAKTGKLRVVGARYDLKSGEVEFFA